MPQCKTFEFLYIYPGLVSMLQIRVFLSGENWSELLMVAGKACAGMIISVSSDALSPLSTRQFSLRLYSQIKFWISRKGINLSILEDKFSGLYP